MIIPIILSGGSGTRLWPVSRSIRPKQFINFINDKTLFSQTIDRVLNKNIFASPIILGNINHKDLLYSEMENNKLYDSKLILEQESRNTAPAIAAVLECLHRDGMDNDLVIFLPSDAYINNNEIFENYVFEGKQFAENNKVVCFGVKPQYPETGYGYIKVSDIIIDNTFLVERFFEKPNLETASDFLKDNRYLWNAGIFMSKVSTLRNLFLKFNENMMDNISTTIDKSIITGNTLTLSREPFSNTENISIDYAIIEHLNSTNLVTVSMDISWSDLGSYKSLHIADSSKTKENNVVKGKVILNNTENCYIKSSKKIICCSDIENLVIIEDDDVILVLKKEKSQNVKELIEICKKEKLDNVI